MSGTLEAGIDCSCVAKPERTGVARYCASLLAELPGAIGPDDRIRQLYRASRWRRRRWILRIDDPRFRTTWFHDGRPSFGARGLDVIHGPDLRIPRVRGVPTVSTVHDLSALDVPGIASEKFRRRKTRALVDVAERATVILCVSEFTERAFLERLPAAAGRTRVVPQGLPPRFGRHAAASAGATLERRGLARPYVLFVGQISARKNLGPLIAGFRALKSRAEFRDLELVLAGPVQTGGAEVVEAAGASRESAAIRFLGFVGDDELPGLYAGAAAFVFPGKGEGFGIPILEAMACGAPVVVADAGANPSTAGDAALAVDANSPDAFAAAIERLLTDSAAREAQVERGLRRAAQFTWAEVARRTVEAYRDAIRIGVPRVKPLRVLHMDTEKGWRGGEQQALYLAEGLARRGVRNLCVGQPDLPYVERCAAKGLEVAPVRTRGEADPRAVVKLRRIFKSWRPDVVHMHTSHAHTLGVLAAKSAGVGRTVVSRRVDFTIYRNALKLSWLKYRFGVDRYVAISEGVRAQMLKDGIPADRNRIVHSGIDLARFDGVTPHDWRAEFGVPPGAPVVLDVAAFGWHKAQEFLVRATPAILEKAPQARVVLVGEGECLPKVRAEAEALGLGGRIIFTGFRTDVPSLLAGADVFVMCSVLEGLCTSLLDALALRRPAVGSAVGGIPEVLIDGVTGLTVPPRDPAALAAAVLRVLGDRALAARLSDAGRRHVEERFTVEAMVEGTLGVYRELLGGSVPA